MTNIEHTDFQNFFNEKLRERSFSLKRLSETTGIALKHLENMSTGRFEHLPPAPYLHGYLLKLGGVLDFDGETWWNNLNDSGFARSSGEHDRLPKNRFARQPIDKRILFGIALILLVGYLAIRLPHILGQPSITILEPAEPVIKTALSDFTLRGQSKNTNELWINEELVAREGGDAWSKTITLQPGLNTVKVTARKFLGRETTMIRQIIYEPAPALPEIKE